MDNPNSSFKETPNWLKWSLTFRCDSCKQGRSSSENSGGREVSIQDISKEEVFLLFLGGAVCWNRVLRGHFLGIKM